MFFDTGANLVSGGAKMALDTTVGAINVGEKALDEKTLDGNGKIRNHNLEEQAGLIGSELVTDGLRLAGAKGLTPSLDKVADLMRSGSGIKQILPEVAKYGAKELGTVLPTSYLQTNLNVMGNGGHFGDAKLEDIAKDTAMNIGTDLAMDIRSGLGRARTVGDVKQLYHDGKLLPNTGLTPNAGNLKNLHRMVEESLIKGNLPMENHIGKMAKRDYNIHNEIQNSLNRPTLEDRNIYANGDNFVEHAQKRFAENPTSETIEKLANSTYNALFGDGRQIIANRNNPYNTLFTNENNPSGVVPVGKNLDTGKTEIRGFIPMSPDKIATIKRTTASEMDVTAQSAVGSNRLPHSLNNVNINCLDPKQWGYNVDGAIGNDNGETTLRSFYPRKTDNIKSDITKDTAINSQNMATHLQEMGAINNIPQNSNDVNFIKQAYHDGIERINLLGTEKIIKTWKGDNSRVKYEKNRANSPL